MIMSRNIPICRTRRVSALSVAAAALLAATSAFAGEKVQQPPTATELWQFRSACIELGQKIVKDTQHLHLTDSVEMSSRYDPATGHCYVLTTVMRVDDRYGHKGDTSVALWDGQTGRILASIHRPIVGEWLGNVDDPQHVSPTLDKFDDDAAVKAFKKKKYEDAESYINRLMSEDRERCQ
jgi:hypothetical protein